MVSRQNASPCAQSGDVIDEPILRVTRQISDEQTLSAPGRWLLWIESGLLQCCPPIATEVDANLSQPRRRYGAQRGERSALEVDHFGLVDFVDRGSGRPRQPMRTRIEPSGNYHE